MSFSLTTDFRHWEPTKGNKQTALRAREAEGLLATWMTLMHQGSSKGSSSKGSSR